ncbi:hypothetical protein EWB00_004748, partial [Schistosoma japonicum]
AYTVVRPTDASVSGISGHKLLIRRCSTLHIQDSDSKHTSCDTWLTFEDTSDKLLKDLNSACSKCECRMKTQPIQLQVQGDPIFLRKQIIFYCLRVAVHKTLSNFCKVFSRIDLKDANHRIPLNEASSVLMTINTSLRLFRHNYLQLGLSYSAAIFQDVINCIVGNLEEVEIYEDNLNIRDPDKTFYD